MADVWVINHGILMELHGQVLVLSDICLTDASVTCLSVVRNNWKPYILHPYSRRPDRPSDAVLTGL